MSGLEKRGGVARVMQWRACMKTKSLSTVFSFVVGGVFVTPLAGQATTPETNPVAVSDSVRESRVVKGRIEARSDNSIIVNGQTIAVIGSTAFIKDAAAVGLTDLNVGDKVRVAATKQVDGTWQAESIEVIKAAE